MKMHASSWKGVAALAQRTFAISAAAIVLVAVDAQALPNVGAAAPHASVEDADGRVIDLHGLKNRPVLVLYEDKDSATLNQPLKDDLSKLARGERYRRSVALVPVADVSAYDFWPVKGFVRDAIRSESRKVGATIYCDFSGSFRSAMKLASGTSSVVLIGKDGKVLYARAGALSKDERAKLVLLLKFEVGE